jgi:hypothetical protein
MNGPLRMANVLAGGGRMKVESLRRGARSQLCNAAGRCVCATDAF